MTGFGATASLGDESIAINKDVTPTGVETTGGVGTVFIWGMVDTGSDSVYSNVNTGSDSTYSGVSTGTETTWTDVA
jgi:hypothetical protein